MCLYVCLSHADIVSKRLNGYSQIESQKSYVLYPWVTLNSNKPPILALFVPFHIVVWALSYRGMGQGRDFKFGTQVGRS